MSTETNDVQTDDIETNDVYVRYERFPAKIEIVALVLAADSLLCKYNHHLNPHGEWTGN